ncbi:sodium:proton antiporter [Alphaproteobacteria bacterium]|nr:sodium:proton antiporter [Alphaproteobacteria bacterium]
MSVKNLPLVLIVVIIASIFLHPIIPYDVKSIIYALSLTIKSIVLCVLPFIIFGLLFKTLVKLSNHAVSVLFLIFGTLCASNFFNTFVACNIGSLLYHFDFDLGGVIGSESTLEPYFMFLIPNIIKNDWALFGGICAGLAAACYNREWALSIANKIDTIVRNLFSAISFLVPLFIIGFVVKSASEGSLVNIIKSYSSILLVFAVYATFHTFVAYYVINKFSLEKCLSCLKNMFPAWLTAISTMSSALAMPVTILSTEQNVKNTELAGSVISATVNVHLLGDCLAIPIIAYALLKNNGFAEPSLYSYFVFTLFFVIAKFSVAAIPGGGILVMIPILEKYLNFTPEMSTLIIAIYIIFDPIITGFNVLGNGALAILIDGLSPKTTNDKV